MPSCLLGLHGNKTLAPKTGIKDRANLLDRASKVGAAQPLQAETARIA